MLKNNHPVFRMLLLLLMCQLLISCSHSRLPAFKRLENYNFKPESTLQSRLGEIPPVLLESLKQLDNRADYRPYKLTPAEFKLFADDLALLPGIHRSAMQKRLAGIYFVENLSSGGYSDFVRGGDGKIYTVLVLNPSLLKTTISEWIKIKELSAFLEDREDISIRVDCGEKGRSALLYLLLHESAHLLDYVAICTPYVEKELAGSGRGLAQVPFVSVAWQDYHQPKPQFDFYQRSVLSFYGNDNSRKLSRSSLPDLYRNLAATPFNILYASQNWAEDFAETAAFSALKSITGKSCLITVDGPGANHFHFSVLERPAVSVRLPQLYSTCSTVY
jgi:hypothetical protein